MLDTLTRTSGEFSFLDYLSILVAIITLTFFILNYLKISNETYLTKRELQAKIEKLRMEQRVLSKNDNDEILNIIKDKIINDDLEKYIDNKLQALTKINLYKEISINIEAVYQHLKSMAIAQNNKASLNLAFGVLSAIAGIAIVIIYLLPDKNIVELSFSTFAMLFIPKLSIIVIIETLAFFFLKLYKKSLDDSKYFINQLTEIRIRFISFNTALLLDNDELIKESVLTILRSQFEDGKEKEEPYSYSADKLIDLITALNKK